MYNVSISHKTWNESREKEIKSFTFSIDRSIDWLLLNITWKTSSIELREGCSKWHNNFWLPLWYMESEILIYGDFSNDEKCSLRYRLQWACSFSESKLVFNVQWEWHSPNTLPTMVYGQVCITSRRLPYRPPWNLNMYPAFTTDCLCLKIKTIVDKFSHVI